MYQVYPILLLMTLIYDEKDDDKITIVYKLPMMPSGSYKYEHKSNLKYNYC